MRKLTVFCLLLISLMIAPAYAIVVCHDYTMYRITKVDPRPPQPGKRTLPGMSYGELERYLKSNGYRPFNYSTAAWRADAGRGLRPGDIVTVGTAHSGYVNSSKHIDHYLQVYGESGVARHPKDLPFAPIPGKRGGLYVSNTFQQFMFNSRVHRGATITIWRPTR